MELNREQIIKALECCGGDIVECRKCAYTKRGYNKCKECAAQDAIVLITELTEENEKLREELIKPDEDYYEIARISYKVGCADTAREMQEILDKKIFLTETKGRLTVVVLAEDIGKTASEVLKNKND